MKGFLLRSRANFARHKCNEEVSPVNLTRNGGMRVDFSILKDDNQDGKASVEGLPLLRREGNTRLILLHVVASRKSLKWVLHHFFAELLM